MIGTSVAHDNALFSNAESHGAIRFFVQLHFIAVPKQFSFAISMKRCQNWKRILPRYWASNSAQSCGDYQYLKSLLRIKIRLSILSFFHPQKQFGVHFCSNHYLTKSSKNLSNFSMLTDFVLPVENLFRKNVLLFKDYGWQHTYFESGMGIFTKTAFNFRPFFQFFEKNVFF